MNEMKGTIFRLMGKVDTKWLGSLVLLEIVGFTGNGCWKMRKNGVGMSMFLLLC